MTIRSPRLIDRIDIGNLYRKYFSDNEYPDFLDDKIFPCPFVVTDENEKIIVAGGVKNIAEVIVLSDQSLPRKVRFEALLQALGSSIFIADGMRHKQIHVFVHNDDGYVKVLEKFGFKLMDAKILTLDFGEPNG